MRRSFRAWLLGALALSLALSACGTQRMGHNAGAQTDGSSQATQETQGTGADLAATPTGSETPGPASASGGRTTAKGPLTPSANATGSQAARTASDRGVTKDQILLGIMAADEATLAALGYTYKGKKHEEVVKPFVDEVNERGGINGRKLVTKVTRYNALSQDDMAARCVEQAEDLKVFATIAPNGFWGDAEVCMANKETPLITASGASADTNYRRDKGWVRQVLWTKDRSVKNWVDWVIATGQVNSKTRNGIIYTDVPEDRQVVNEVFIPYMKKRGLQVTEVAALSYPGSTSPDASASEAETQASVLKFKASGVELVWPLSNPLQVYLWVKSADAAQYKPRYTVCDATGMTTSITSIYPPSQWEGVKGITVLRTGEVPAGSRPTHQTYKECEAVYKAHGETIAPNPDDASKLDDTEIASMENYCELVSLFAEVAKRAGINPTRRSLLAGFNDLGTWTSRVAMTEQLSFSKTKYDGADYFEVVRWDSGCTCYRQVEGFRKGTW